MAFADAPPSPGSTFHRILSKIIDVRPSEVPALAWSWLYIFFLLSSYYIMRPIRDQMGVAGGVNNLQWLFTGTLIGMLLLNLPFSYLVKTFPRAKFITISYRFFSANILLFALALYAATPEQTIWVGRIFFIWTSVFNLFVVSIFWQMIVDLFTSDQGKRLFGFIAAGATLGAISGSLFTVSTVEHMAPAYLMIGAALMLEVAVFCVRRLSGLSDALSERPQVDQQPEKPIGGTLLGGIRDALSSSYLLNVSLFLLLYAVTTTFLYFQQAAVVSQSFQSRAAQTQFFATVDLGVNVLTLAVQLFLTGRILKRFGVGITLSLLPVFSVIGFGALASAPYPVVRRYIPNDPACRQFCNRTADARSPVHRAAARGSLQGEELYRHRCLPAGRPDRSLVVRASQLYRPRTDRGFNRRCGYLRTLAGQWLVARPPTGHSCTTAGSAGSGLANSKEFIFDEPVRCTERKLHHFADRLHAV